MKIKDIQDWKAGKKIKTSMTLADVHREINQLNSLALRNILLALFVNFCGSQDAPFELIWSLHTRPFMIPWEKGKPKPSTRIEDYYVENEDDSLKMPSLLRGDKGFNIKKF